jgi:hypothetical protein
MLYLSTLGCMSPTPTSEIWKLKNKIKLQVKSFFWTIFANFQPWKIWFWPIEKDFFQKEYGPNSPDFKKKKEKEKEKVPSFCTRF